VPKEVELDQGRTFVDTLIRLQHRHEDAWQPMSEREGTHGAAEKDVERGWSRGRIFRCDTCEEEILVEQRPEAGG